MGIWGYNKINSITREYASHFLDNCFVFDGQSFEKRKKKGKKKGNQSFILSEIQTSKTGFALIVKTSFDSSFNYFNIVRQWIKS